MSGVSYDDLVAAATIGLSRRPIPITGLAGPAARHAGLLDRDDPAAAALDAAALLITSRRAGARPAAGVTCPSPATADTAPELPARAGDALARVRTDPALLADLLTAAASAGYRAPAPMLPVLLDAAVKHADLRPAVAAVLGNRGRWLAAHRAGWRHAVDAPAPEVPDDPAVWETGSRGERHAYLTMLRDRDPAAARALLAAGWAQETGEDRAGLLAVLSRRLSAADEEFLEAALDDRKAPVRAAAAALLTRLPASAFARRAAERAAPLLRVERRGMRRRLVARLPEGVDGSAFRDGIVARPPAQAIGARAWLLTQLIAAAPLAGWTARFGLDPGQIVSLPVGGDLAVEVHGGWRLAAIRQADPAWAEALLAAAGPPGAARRPPAAWPPDPQLAAVLPPEAQAARAAALLTGNRGVTAAIAAAVACPGPWPDSLAQAVVAVVERAVVPATTWPGWLEELLQAAARNLPATGPAAYAAILTRLAGTATCPPSWSVALRRTAGIITLRRAFLEEIS